MGIGRSGSPIFCCSTLNGGPSQPETAETEVLLHHNYLHGAYTALRDTNLFRRFYLTIREMAKRDWFIEEGEYALYALAANKKPADIPLIDSILWANHNRLGRIK